jgi:hypothetical protein
MLRELPDLSVEFTSAAWSIVRGGIVDSTSQAGSAEMCREVGRQTGSGTNCNFLCVQKLIYISDKSDKLEVA